MTFMPPLIAFNLPAIPKVTFENHRGTGISPMFRTGGLWEDYYNGGIQSSGRRIGLRAQPFQG